MLRPLHYYPFDQIASPNFLNQGVFQYFLSQPFYIPKLIVNMVRWGSGLGNIKIKARINNLIMTI